MLNVLKKCKIEDPKEGQKREALDLEILFGTKENRSKKREGLDLEILFGTKEKNKKKPGGRRAIKTTQIPTKKISLREPTAEEKQELIKDRIVPKIDSREEFQYIFDEIYTEEMPAKKFRKFKNIGSDQYFQRTWRSQDLETQTGKSETLLKQETLNHISDLKVSSMSEGIKRKVLTIGQPREEFFKERERDEKEEHDDDDGNDTALEIRSGSISYKTNIPIKKQTLKCLSLISEIFISSTNNPKNKKMRSLPQLDREYISKYLRQEIKILKERICCYDEKCESRFSRNSSFGNSKKRTSFSLREFLLPEEEDRFKELNHYDFPRKPCIMCNRFITTNMYEFNILSGRDTMLTDEKRSKQDPNINYEFNTTGLLDTGIFQDHTYKIKTEKDVRNAYSLDQCLIPDPNKGRLNGIIAPFVKYDPKSYQQIKVKVSTSDSIVEVFGYKEFDPGFH